MNVKIRLPEEMAQLGGKILETFDDEPLLTPESKYYLNGLKAFIIQRCKLLEDKINAEEMDGEKYILLNLITGDLSLVPVGYSEQLANKIADCFSEADFSFVTLKLLGHLDETK